MSSKKNINVFISSDMLELELDREIIQDSLKGININAVLFELFPALSQSPSEAYLDEIENCDIFILVLWKNFSKAVYDEFLEAAKKNKPLIVLIKSLIDNEERDNKMKDLINGIKSGIYQNVVYKNYRKVTELTQVVRDSVANEVSKFYIEPTIALSRQEMYDLGTNIIKFSQRRVYIFQKTPSLFLGSRSYLDPDENKYGYEQDFLVALESWIENKYLLNDKEFLYLFSEEATKAEIIKYNLNNNDLYLQKLKDKIAKYKRIELKSNYRFRFCPITTPISGPLIVGDSRFAMWFIGVDDSISFSQRNEKISDILVRMLKVKCQNILDESCFNIK